MAFRRLRKIAHRILKDADGVVGPGFSDAHTAAFAEVESDAEVAFQLVGSALVSTWEVGITEIGRALMGRLPEDERRSHVERISDSLVPLQRPLRQAGQSVGAGVQQGVQAGRLSGELGPATAPLIAILEPLPVAVEEGWASATEYLQPVFDSLPDPPESRVRFAQGGSSLADAFSDAASTYASAMARLAESTDLQRDLAHAMLQWQHAVCRSIEHIVFDRLGGISSVAWDIPLETGH